MNYEDEINETRIINQENKMNHEEKSSRYQPIEDNEIIVIESRKQTKIPNVEVISYYYKEQEAEDPLQTTKCIYNNKSYFSSSLDEEGFQEFIEENSVVSKSESEALELATLIYKYNGEYTILDENNAKDFNLGDFDKSKIINPVISKVVDAGLNLSGYKVDFYVYFKNEVAVFMDSSHSCAYFINVELYEGRIKIKKNVIYSSLKAVQ